MVDPVYGEEEAGGGGIGGMYRTLDFRTRRAQDDFQKAIKCPGVDPEFIEAQAYRFRLITATLGNRMNELITLLGEGHEPNQH